MNTTGIRGKENNMKNIRFCWPGGKFGAVTSSWDDGTEYDRRLIDIFNRFGLKGSFYPNSNGLGKTAAESGWKNYVRADEIPQLYQGHEIGSHTVSHPYLWQLPRESLAWEFMEDRRRLEALTGYPIRGAVIPFGWPSGLDTVVSLLSGLGFRYLRNSQTNGRFDLPGDFLRWQPTVHCSADLDTSWSQFQAQFYAPAGLFYMWGHSYEFEDRKEWDKLERWAEKTAQTSNLWHGTNGQVYDYVTAWRNLAWSAEVDRVYNPSAQTVFFLCDGQPCNVAASETKSL